MVQSWALGSHTSSVQSATRGKKSSAARHSSKQSAHIGLFTARILFIALAFLLLFGGFTLVKSFASEEHIQPASAQEKVIYADSGDTLWGLASSLKKDSMDTRRAVQLLMHRNGLTTSSLQNGQSLIVPAELLP